MWAIWPGLPDADSYDPKYAKWRYDDLPILPSDWKNEWWARTRRNSLIFSKSCCAPPDVTEVVNACDAGREGELIFRNVYELAGCKSP